ncbi:hypothetical protein Rhe02_72010 [Rhizocola hellebori]|uniref:Uncharacterized protein n=1 Tax=Rhizocola hellebori TaxID=1392758 RepID=A0A8J3QE46_9ACTN|nr:hypothetical protein Rhe02_72010 [Rhizocola hellebori]
MGLVSVTVVVTLAGALDVEFAGPGSADGTVPAHALRPIRAAMDTAARRLLILTSPSLGTPCAEGNQLY